MKATTGTLFILLWVFLSVCSADNVIGVKNTTVTDSDHLDLNAVASLFSQSKDLEDFENKLNDPQIGVSNLDLNNDGQVDYLRVVEAVKGETHNITLQAVIGHNQFQDVATLTLTKDDQGEVTVHIVGAADIYGENYTIAPNCAPPLLPLLFWASQYRPWHSQSNWGRYPNHYRPWAPLPLEVYRSHIRNSHDNIKTKTEIIISPNKTGNHRVWGTQSLKNSANGATISKQSTALGTDKTPLKQNGNRVLITRP